MALAAASRVLLRAGGWPGRERWCAASQRAGCAGGGGESPGELANVLRAVRRIPPRAQGGRGRRAALLQPAGAGGLGGRGG